MVKAYIVLMIWQLILVTVAWQLGYSAGKEDEIERIKLWR